MNPLTDRIREWLVRELGGEPQQWEGETILHNRIEGERGDKWNQAVVVREQHRQVAIYAYLPRQCPKNRFREMLVALNRLNYRMVCGCFEMDMDDGEVSFRHGFDFMKVVDDTGDVLDALFSVAYFTASAEMDRWMKALEGVMDGGDPTALVAEGFE